MVYEWKFAGLYPVPAQAAGQELDRIYRERGKLDPADIVDESRPEDAVLHPCFEWRDTVAAELYREQQARGIVRCIVTTAKSKQGEPVQVRAIVKAAGTYRPLTVVLESPDMEREMIQAAMRDMMAFQEKYSSLVSLAPVFDAIESIKLVLDNSAE